MHLCALAAGICERVLLHPWLGHLAQQHEDLWVPLKSFGTVRIVFCSISRCDRSGLHAMLPTC